MVKAVNYIAYPGNHYIHHKQIQLFGYFNYWLIQAFAYAD